MECFSRFLAIFKNNCNFFKFLIFFRHQGPRDLLQGLIIGWCIVSRVNGIAINFFYDPSFRNFFHSWKIFVMFQWYGPFWASETISVFKKGYWIVSCGNETVLKMLLSWILGKSLLKFAIVFKTFQCFLSFSDFNDPYWPTKILSLGDGLLDRTFYTKNGLNFFTEKLKTFFFNVAFFSFFFNMMYLLTRLQNYHGKCSYLFLSVSVKVSFLLFLVHVLSLSISLSLFVDAALQLLICGVMSSSHPH